MLTPEQVEVRRKWTEALRSGRYTQTKLFLRDDGSYCCLGVLCDVVDPDGWAGDKHRGMGSYPETHVADAAHLPRNDHTGARWYVDGTETQLYDLNDREGFTFDEIADVIDLDTLMHLDGAL